MTENKIEPKPPTSPNSGTPKSSPFGSIIFTIIIACLAGAAGFLLGQRQTSTNALNNPLSQKVNLTPKIGEPSPIPTEKTLPQPTLVVSGDHNTYVWDKYKLTFDFAPIWEKLPVGVTISGDKLYIGPTQYKPESGQSLEVFSKKNTDSLSEAIQKKFLINLSPDECFVKMHAPDAKMPTGFELATIAYPVPTNAPLPAFAYGEKCPEMYKESNGIAYFMMDPNHPEIFIYISIGQQIGPSASTGVNSSQWFKTIRFTQ
jgi:hypothetical protein